MSSPEIYWLDGCNSKEGWIDESYGGIWLPYNGDFHEAPNCFRMFVRYVTYERITISKPISLLVPPQNGIFRCVIGAWVKFKRLTGALNIDLLSASGQIIGGLGIGGRDIWLHAATTSGLYTRPGDVFPVNEWINFEMVISPQRGELYINGVKVYEDTNTRHNEPPAKYRIEELPVPYESGGFDAEHYIDTVYVTSSPHTLPAETYPLTITQSANGVTDPIAGEYVVPTAQIVTIMATPAEGYSLDYWSVNGLRYGPENPLIFVMSRPYIIQPVFASPEPPPNGGDGGFPWWLIVIAGILGIALTSKDKKKKKQ